MPELLLSILRMLFDLMTGGDPTCSTLSTATLTDIGCSVSQVLTRIYDAIP